jgi:hypothetical protein
MAAPLESVERDGLAKDFGETYTRLQSSKRALMARVMDPCVR